MINLLIIIDLYGKPIYFSSVKTGGIAVLFIENLDVPGTVSC